MNERNESKPLPKGESAYEDYNDVKSTASQLPELPEKRADNEAIDINTFKLAMARQRDVNQLITCLEAVYKRLGN